MGWAKRQEAFKQKKNVIKHLRTRFDNYPLMSFSTMMLEEYQTERLEKGNKNATVNRYISTIKHMFTKAADWEMVSEDILRKIRKVKQLPENNRRLRYLTKDECQELINSCEPHLKPIVIVAINTGMRKSEILNLRWDQVDLKHGFILLDKTKNGEREDRSLSIIP